MKKIVVASFLALVGLTANAQTTFGVKGGLNVSSVRTNDDELNSELKARPTFHIGGFANIGLGKSFILQPQLLLSGKGANIKHDDHTDAFKFTSLDIPVNFLYNAGNGFWVGAGPNFGINLSGVLETHENGMHEEEKFEFGSAAGEIKRFDIGANFTAGYQMKNGILFSANYTAGLSNWSNVSTEKWRNNIAAISVGYVFGKKKK